LFFPFSTRITGVDIFCPYGALIGILGWASALRIVRNKKTCIDCSKCTIVCPVYIEVEKKNTVYNLECLGCYDCIDSCPVEDTLDMKLLDLARRYIMQCMPAWLWFVRSLYEYGTIYRILAQQCTSTGIHGKDFRSGQS
jgi:polyferredoxin